MGKGGGGEKYQADALNSRRSHDWQPRRTRRGKKKLCAFVRRRKEKKTIRLEERGGRVGFRYAKPNKKTPQKKKKKKKKKKKTKKKKEKKNKNKKKKKQQRHVALCLPYTTVRKKHGGCRDREKRTVPTAASAKVRAEERKRIRRKKSHIRIT